MTFNVRRSSALGAAGAALAAALAVSGGAPVNAELPALPAVPAPTVQGPIAATAPPGDISKNYPFLATPIDLAARGYVEEEFFISGNACSYTGLGLTTATPGPCAPYTTRIIVRRPTSVEAFNGTVLAEWQNVTAQYEVDHYWHESSEHIIRSGYAWVGISAQRAGIQPLPASPATGINTLKAWNPVRYAALDVTNAGTVLNDALRFDIYSQAIQALRAPTAIDPLGPLDPTAVLAIGTSQSGSNLATYHNSIRPLTQPVVDGFFIGESRGLLRTDQSVPVFRFLSEVDARANFTPADAANYRHWEVAGASHAGAGFLDNIVPLLARDRVVTAPTQCRRPAPSRIPKKYTYDAAFDHLATWVRPGVLPPVLPPVAPRIQFAGVLATSLVSRNSDGNARGGIQLSEHAIATAENSATNGPSLTVPPLLNPGGFFCGLFGTYVPFTDARLNDLYRNTGRYVSQVARVNEANVAAGFILAIDSDISTSDAARSAVGK